MASSKAVVLFYKYFVPSECPELLTTYAEFYVNRLEEFLKCLCLRLHLKGRILLSTEGINGTLSGADKETISSFVSAMESLNLVGDCGMPTESSVEDGGCEKEDPQQFLFREVDWKQSMVEEGVDEPFPDLKISIVKEIVSTGGQIHVDDIPGGTGKHLSPEEFHKALVEEPGGKEVVLIDVRNTFEYDIGHFVLPNSGRAAMNPEMVTFSSFDPTFCAKHADSFKDKKVLMYCTGGIRCEKASVMLSKRGVRDVNQLSGGIHRYLEQYGNHGHYKGLNFVFDQRVAMRPDPTKPQNEVVGRCMECQIPFDEICGSRVCTVCRDLVLICPTCRSKLREYHCQRHSAWKDCYFTFLEPYAVDELDQQKLRLLEIRESEESPPSKNVRRTLTRQLEKIAQHEKRLESGEISVNPDAPTRCRTCMESSLVCDGRCWGFWKSKAPAPVVANTQAADTSSDTEVSEISGAILPVKIGDCVEPSNQWNEGRLGEKTDLSGAIRQGQVVEIKGWSGDDEMDCVSVLWDDLVTRGRNQGKVQPQIYRWGVRGLNGTRLYDVQLKM